MDLATLGIQVTSGPAVKGAADLDKLTVAAAKAEDQVQDLAASSARLGPALGGVSRAAGGLSTNARMLSQQLSQVGQMTMVTGNFTQALAVQLPDIGLAFGAIGAAAGLVAGVALPMVVTAFGGASREAERLRETLDRSADAVTAYTKAVDAALQPNERLIESYGRLSGAAGRALQAMADIKQIEAIKSVSESIKNLNDTFIVMEQKFGRSGAAGYKPALADDFGLAADEASRLLNGILALNRTNGLENQALAAEKVRQELISAYGSIGAMEKAMPGVAGALAEIVIQAGGVQGAMEKSTTWTEALSGAASLLPGIFDQAAGAARGIAGAMQSALDKATAMVAANDRLAEMKFEFSGGGQAQIKYGSRAPGGNAAQDALENRYAPPKVPAGAGGGGSVAEDFASRLQGITEGLQTERETIDTWYADAQTILADRRAQEILGEEGHKQALIALEQKYQGELVALKEQEGALVRSAASNMYTELGGLLTAFGGKSKAAAVAAIILNKGLRIAEIIQNTAAAQMRAFAELGPIAGAAAAAKIGMFGKLQAGIVAATGLAQISGAGGGGGGGVPSTGPAAQAVQPQQQPQQTLIVQGIKANDIFTGQMIYDMFMGEGRLRGAPVVQLMR